MNIPSFTLSSEEKTYEILTDVFWNRFWAFIADSLIVTFIISLLLSVFGVPVANTSNDFFYSQSTAISIIHTTTFSLTVSWSYLVLFVYYFTQEWLFGLTIGKNWFGLSVVSLDGTAPPWWRVFMRNLIRPFDYGLLFIGFFLVRFDRFHQRLGDRAGGTIVVQQKSLVDYLISKRQLQIRLRILLAVLGLFIIGCFAFTYYARPPLVIEGMYNLQQPPFYVSPQPALPGSTQVFGQQPQSCITGYTLGTPTRTGNSISYPVTFHISHGTVPDKTGTIQLDWNGFLGGWRSSASDGPSICQP